MATLVLKYVSMYVCIGAGICKCESLCETRRRCYVAVMMRYEDMRKQGGACDTDEGDESE